MAFGLHKRQLAVSLTPMLQLLEVRIYTYAWQGAAAHQRPSQVWAYANELTEYQVQTCHKIISNKLNLYHAGRHDGNSCRELSKCRGVNYFPVYLPLLELSESSSVLEQVTRPPESCLTTHLEGKVYFISCAGRQAPDIPTQQLRRIYDVLKLILS